MPDIKTDLIRSSPYQPRLDFKVEDIKEEIKKDGLLSTLVVRKVGKFYELIDGERRWRALKELGWKKVPVEVRNVPDDLARRIVYKLNKIRESYSTEDEARYFKKLADEGMKPYQIETQLSVNHQWVQTHLNVWKFPKDVQNHIFGKGLSGRSMYFYISDIRDLEPVINRNLDDAIAIAKQIIAERLEKAEKKELIGRRKKAVDEERLKRVEAALPKIEVKPPETAEEFEEAARVLEREAKKRRTPEQIRRENVASAKKSLKTTVEKIDKVGEVIDVGSFRKRLDKIKSTLERDPSEAKDQLVALGKEATEAGKRRRAELREEAKRKREEEAKEKAKKREEALKKRVEKETRGKLLEEEEFLEKAIEKKRKKELKKAKARVKAEVEPWTEKMASDIADKIEDALVSIAKEVDVKKTAGKKRLMKNYLFQGSIVQSLQNREIFDPEDPKDTMLEWSRSRRNLSQTREILKRELGIK